MKKQEWLADFESRHAWARGYRVNLTRVESFFYNSPVQHSTVWLVFYSPVLLTAGLCIAADYSVFWSWFAFILSIVLYVPVWYLLDKIEIRAENKVLYNQVLKGDYFNEEEVF